MPRVKREIAKMLATGASTKETAEKLGLTHGRISQIRGELRNDWESFQAEALALA
jgi:hypothetical protein